MHSNLLPRIQRSRLLLLLAPTVVILLSACGTGNPQDTFDTRGPVAETQGNLFKVIFWIAVVVFVLVQGGIIWITLRYRRKSDDEMPKQIHGNIKLELTWTIIPTLIIIAIAIPTVRTIWDLADPPLDESVMTVEAVGHQWWFEFRYPESEIVTANELRVPVGQNVRVILQAQDVIHSFWVPVLFGKVDMVPNRDNELWFRADEPGNYYGQCAEFCGLAHALMRFRVIAQPQDEYDEWVSGMQSAPDAPAAESAESRGRTLFAANCSTCHTTDTYAAGGYERELSLQESRWDGWLADRDNSRIVSAPNLTHFGTRTTIGAGITDLTRETLLQWINNPGDLKPSRMQDHAAVYQTANGTANLSDNEVSDIADYLLSLVPGDASASPSPTPVIDDPVALGQTTFNDSCASCHTTTDQTTVGPGLGGIEERAGTRVSGLSADEYLEQSIREPQAYLVDGFGPVMPDLPLSDDQVNGLIEYLKTLD